MDIGNHNTQPVSENNFYHKGIKHPLKSFLVLKQQNQFFLLVSNKPIKLSIALKRKKNSLIIQNEADIDD